MGIKNLGPRLHILNAVESLFPTKRENRSIRSSYDGNMECVMDDADYIEYESGYIARLKSQPIFVQTAPIEETIDQLESYIVIDLKSNHSFSKKISTGSNLLVTDDIYGQYNGDEKSISLQNTSNWTEIPLLNLSKFVKSSFVSDFVSPKFIGNGPLLDEIFFSNCVDDDVDNFWFGKFVKKKLDPFRCKIVNKKVRTMLVTNLISSGFGRNVGDLKKKKYSGSFWKDPENTVGERGTQALLIFEPNLPSRDHPHPIVGVFLEDPKGNIKYIKDSSGQFSSTWQSEPFKELLINEEDTKTKKISKRSKSKTIVDLKRTRIDRQGFNFTVFGKFGCESGDDCLPPYGESDVEDYEFDSEWDCDLIEEERLSKKREETIMKRQELKNSRAELKTMKMENGLNIKVFNTDSISDIGSDKESDLENFDDRGWPINDGIGNSENVSNFLPSLSSIQVKKLINQYVVDLSETWHKNFQPKLEMKKGHYWKKDRSRIHLLELEVKELENRLWYKYVPQMETNNFTDPHAVLRVCGTLDETIKQKCSLKWRINNAKSTVMPANEVTMKKPQNKSERKNIISDIESSEEDWNNFIDDSLEMDETITQVEVEDGALCTQAPDFDTHEHLIPGVQNQLDSKKTQINEEFKYFEIPNRKKHTNTEVFDKKTDSTGSIPKKSKFLKDKFEIEHISQKTDTGSVEATEENDQMVQEDTIQIISHEEDIVKPVANERVLKNITVNPTREVEDRVVEKPRKKVQNSMISAQECEYFNADYDAF
ncbi:hypothetical protein HK096_002276 [Nowakowskiella sp. JEL0078]|nr:hypothetical protein HK096_002276 [Nowakowskiella sp. JEL0078]